MNRNSERAHDNPNRSDSYNLGTRGNSKYWQLSYQQRGTADTMFVNSNDNFTITVTAPDNQDYEGQAISANIPESRTGPYIYVILNKASHVSGKVFAGKSPIDSAHVFLVQSQSPECTGG